MEMGYRAYARHRGVTLGAVQKAIRDKRIHLNANNKIDSEAADRDWKQNTDVSRVAVNVLAPVQQSIPLAPPDDADTPPAAGKADADEVTGTDRVANEYREHRSERERYQALKQKLEYEQLVGKLIDVDEARRIAYTSFRSLRDAVVNITPRVKDQLAAISDPDEIERILDREHHAALSGMDVAKLLKDQDQEE